MSSMLYLVDASVYIFRAWFALPDTMCAPDGAPVQAVYGFARFLAELLERERPRWIACAFDESLTSSFRNRRWPAYKANRALPPPDLERQLKLCERTARALGIATFASRRYEADDIIGTLARRHRAAHRPVVIITRDKDLAQLVRPGDVLWDYAADVRLDPRALQARLGVAPERVPDLLALAGDPVDNIPGVPGIGMKTAIALLREFNDLDALYAALDRVPHLPLRGAARIAERLLTGRELALLSRELATVYCDVPLRTRLDDLRWRGARPASVNRLCNTLGFGQRLRARLLALMPERR